jgi:tRNA(fMet)-specific endonuclease VapC
MTSASAALIDTDILSSLMRGNPLVTTRARSYLEVHERLTFSVITRYEVLRGLLAKNAARQMAAFDQLCGASQVLPLTGAIIVQAAAIYVDLSQRGELINDADILIAATAATHGLVMVTNNENHSRRIPNLQIDN